MTSKKQILEPRCAVLVPPSPCLLANHITLPGREIPGAGSVLTLPKGHHCALNNNLQAWIPNSVSTARAGNILI